jgi:hypothetical protein
MLQNPLMANAVWRMYAPESFAASHVVDASECERVAIHVPCKFPVMGHCLSEHRVLNFRNFQFWRNFVHI